MSGSSLVKSIAMTIVADDGDAQAKIADVSAKADKLARPHSLTVTADTGEATEALGRYDEAATEAAGASERLAAASKEAGDAQDESAAKTDAAAEASAGFGDKVKVAALGAAVGIGYAVDQAMKFQEQSTTLVTGAGESEKALGMVKAGMLAISAATATSLPQVVSGMYMIESAGYHGAAGLQVLQAAAEGAKVGNADLGTVANATTTVLTDYKMGAEGAASATSGLIETVAEGKTHLQDLSSSLSKVLPTAAALKVSFPEVGGAMATMTAEGVSARLAATHLNSTMLAMVSPTKASAAAMAAVGLSSSQVANTLTHQGLIAALEMVTDAAGKKFPPGSAAYVNAVSTMLRGQSGLAVALELTGDHLGTLKSDTEAVAASMKGSSKDVQGWADVQKDASFQLEKTEISAKDAAVAFGDALLPAVEKILGPVSSFAEFVARSSAASTTLAVVVGGVLSLYLGSKLVGVFSEVKSAGEGVISAVTGIATRLGILTPATEEATVAQGELDVAMDANPIGLVVLAVAALIGVVILVVTHLRDFKQWGLDAFHAVEHAAEDALSWVKGHWPLLLAILTGPIGLATLFIVDHWHQIVDGADTMFRDIEHFFEKLPGDILGWTRDFGHLLWTAGADLLKGLVSGIESEVGAVVGEVENVGHSILSGIEGALGIGSPSKEMHVRGMFAAQGLALGLIDGIPLVAGASHQLAAATMAGYSGGASRPVAGAAGSYGGGDTINLTVNGFVGNETQLMTQIQQGLRTLKRRNGGAPLGLT